MAEMEQIHPNLFHGVTREEWRSAVDGLDARIGTLRADQVTVELMRLVALVSSRGRDGHMAALPSPETHPPVYGLGFYLFSDGLFVDFAVPAYSSLLGARVTAIDGHPVEEVLRAVDPLVPRDSPASVPMWLPRYLVMPEVLTGLGIASTVPTPFTIVDRAGRERTVAVGTVPLSTYLSFTNSSFFRLPPAKVLWLSRIDTTFWWKYLPSSRTLFVQYNAVQRLGQAAIDAMRRRGIRPDVKRVVLDLRNNLGGDNTVFRPLVAALAQSKFNRPKKLYVLIGRSTFSAAGNLATELDRSTNATFVGEPAGGGINQYGQMQEVHLDELSVPLTVPVSTIWFETAPGDQRLMVSPEIAAPLSSRDWLAGRDPALRAVVAKSR